MHQSEEWLQNQNEFSQYHPNIYRISPSFPSPTVSVHMRCEDYQSHEVTQDTLDNTSIQKYVRQE
jgi:hypothetical protein